IAAINPTFASVTAVEVLATALTLFLSKFLKTDPTRSFVLSLLIPITWLTLADSITVISVISGVNDQKFLQLLVAFQLVCNNTAVLTFLTGSLVFLFTSAFVVRNKRVPRSWPFYIFILIGSMGLSIAEYFKNVFGPVPQYILHGAFCISAGAMVVLMIAIPIYTHFSTASTMTNTTDQAVFNAKWRLFWAYLYMIVPSVRSIFVIIRAIGEIDEKWKANKSALLIQMESIIDLSGCLFYLIPIYFFLPAYRSCIFFCFKSREMNPHFFFVKVIPQKSKERRLSLNKVRPADATKNSRANELQDTSLEDVHENHQYQRAVKRIESRSPSPQSPKGRKNEVNRVPSVNQQPRLSIATLNRNEQFPHYNNVRVPISAPPPSRIPFAHGEIGSIIHHPKSPLTSFIHLVFTSYCSRFARVFLSSTNFELLI
ncbi:hypothetical protein PFISCL1PPCAC_14947, partial [Pristionchus fissidentatus]